MSVSRDDNGYDADHDASDLIVGDLETEWVAARLLFFDRLYFIFRFKLWRSSQLDKYQGMPIQMLTNAISTALLILEREQNFVNNRSIEAWKKEKRESVYPGIAN